MKKTDTLPCEVVRDLLPLYLEDLTGSETREMIDRHLTDCSECSQYVNLMKDGESSVSEAEEEDRKEIDYLKQIRRKSRRKYILSVLSVFLVLLMGAFYFTAGPSETKKMEQALTEAENVATRELDDVVNAVTGMDTASLSYEKKEAKINAYYEKADRYLAGQLNSVVKDTFQNLLNREDPDIPMDSVIDRRMKTDRVSFAHYEGSRNCAYLTTRRQIMELSVTHDWLEHDENGGVIGCYRIRFTCSHVKERTQMVRDEGNWKVLHFDYEPVEIEPSEQYQIRLFGEETVSQIRQTVQKQFDTFEEARTEAEKLQKLVFTDEVFPLPKDPVLPEINGTGAIQGTSMKSYQSIQQMCGEAYDIVIADVIRTNENIFYNGHVNIAPSEVTIRESYLGRLKKGDTVCIEETGIRQPGGDLAVDGVPLLGENMRVLLFLTEPSGEVQGTKEGYGILGVYQGKLFIDKSGGIHSGVEYSDQARLSDSLQEQLDLCGTYGDLATLFPVIVNPYKHL